MPSLFEQRLLHVTGYQPLYIFSTFLQLLCGYIEIETSSIISFVGRLLKFVFYLFATVLCNRAFSTSIVSSNRNRFLICCDWYLGKDEIRYFLHLSRKGRDLPSIVLDYCVFIGNFFFSVVSYLAENTYSLNYKDQSRRRSINVRSFSGQLHVIFVRF